MFRLTPDLFHKRHEMKSRRSQSLLSRAWEGTRVNLVSVLPTSQPKAFHLLSVQCRVQGVLRNTPECKWNMQLNLALWM